MLLYKEIENMKDSISEKIQSNLISMDNTVDKLKQNIEYTDFKDKAKTAFPIALTSSILTLALYFLLTYFIK